MSSEIFSKSSCIRTTSLLSIAISVPLPTATPMSAVTRLTLSFIPSPHIITKPFSFNSLIFSAFSFGSTFAITCLMPIWFAIALAVFSLSPVSITTLVLCSCNFSTTSAAESFIMSFTPNKAINLNLFSSWMLSATNRILFPSFSNSSSSFIAALIFTLFSFINLLLPIKYLLLLYSALTP